MKIFSLFFLFTYMLRQIDLLEVKQTGCLSRTYCMKAYGWTFTWFDLVYMLFFWRGWRMIE